jgi:FlaA1/EpsC-like NDP-sugar epimerase
MKTREQETVLITGATGTVGSEVIKQLSEVTPSVNIKANPTGDNIIHICMGTE